MAITEVQAPSAIASRSAHGNLYHVVSSDNTAQPNFKFVFEIFIGTTKIATVKRWPEPGTIYGKCDVAEIVRTQLSNLNFAAVTDIDTGWVGSGTFYTVYTVKYGEEYGSPVTAYLNLLVSGSKKVFNTSTSLNHPTTDLVSGYVSRFITARPRELWLSKTDKLIIPYWKIGGSVTYSFKTYNASGTLLGTSTRGSTMEINSLNVGYKELSTAYPATFAGAVDYYTISAGSDLIKVNVGCTGLYGHTNLVFMNAFGVYESFTFTGKSRKSMDIDRKYFGKPSMKFIAPTGMSYSETAGSMAMVGNAQASSVSKKYKFKLTTHFLSDLEFDWLAQLVASPVIYIELLDSTGTYYMPVKISATNYDFLTRANDKLNPLEVELEVLNNYNSQFA